jgi:hypothetical protein
MIKNIIENLINKNEKKLIKIKKKKKNLNNNCKIFEIK